jgi:hypothetical protein
MPLYLVVLVGSPGLVTHRKFQKSRDIVPNTSGMFVGYNLNLRYSKWEGTNHQERMNEVYIFKFWLVKTVREHIEGLFR